MREELVLMLLFYSIKLSCSLGITQSIGKHHHGVVTYTKLLAQLPGKTLTMKTQHSLWMVCHDNLLARAGQYARLQSQWNGELPAYQTILLKVLWLPFGQLHAVAYIHPAPPPDQPLYYKGIYASIFTSVQYCAGISLAYRPQRRGRGQITGTWQNSSPG